MAVIVGLMGFDGGLLWLVAGVWTVRAVWGTAPGLAWGIACLGAAARWGTMTLADVESATRIFGPTVASGGPAVRWGMTAGLVAAVVSEARTDGLRARSWPERVAALAALAALVALYCVPGPGDPAVLTSLGLWALAGAALVAVTLALGRAAAAAPGWAPPVVAAVGLLVARL